MKLTRKEIKEGLEQIPVEKLLLGSAAHGIGLTKKQKAFANEVVKSGNKTKAYKAAYNHTGKPETASRNAQTLANDTKVATYIAALEAAEQARAYLIPARLRDLAIHKITEKALDPAVPPAQQLKALELLGKITEVSLFTHRTETVHLTSSADIKEQLIKSLRLAMAGNNVTDVEAKPVDDLLAELAGHVDPDDDSDSEATNILYDVTASDPPDNISISDPLSPSGNAETQTPPSPDPQKSAITIPPQLHSIPLNQSPQESKSSDSTLESAVTVTGVTVTQGKPLDGEGVIKNDKNK
jgi:hypothetical protein